MSEEWRFCHTCGGETTHVEHDVKHGYIPYTCKECGTNTALMGYNEDDTERVEEVRDES